MGAKDESMKIKPNEIELVGQWIESQGKVSVDPICERINQLTSEYLTEISKEESGWEIRILLKKKPIKSPLKYLVTYWKCSGTS